MLQGVQNNASLPQLYSIDKPKTQNYAGNKDHKTSMEDIF